MNSVWRWGLRLVGSAGVGPWAAACSGGSAGVGCRLRRRAGGRGFIVRSVLPLAGSALKCCCALELHRHAALHSGADALRTRRLRSRRRLHHAGVMQELLQGAAAAAAGVGAGAWAQPRALSGRAQGSTRERGCRWEGVGVGVGAGACAGRERER